MTGQMMTPGQVAAKLNVDEATVRHWCRTKQLRAAKLGTLWRIDPADVRAKLNEAYKVQEGPQLYADVLADLTAGIPQKSRKIGAKKGSGQASQAA